MLKRIQNIRTATFLLYRRVVRRRELFDDVSKESNFMLVLPTARFTAHLWLSARGEGWGNFLQIKFKFIYARRHSHTLSKPTKYYLFFKKNYIRSSSVSSELNAYYLMSPNLRCWFYSFHCVALKLKLRLQHNTRLCYSKYF